MTDFTDHVRLDINVSDDVAEKLDAMTEQELVAVVDAAMSGAQYQPTALAHYVAEYGFAMIGTRQATEMVAVRIARTAVELEAALVGLLDAFPRLSKDYSEARQQEALRAARKVVGR